MTDRLVQYRAERGIARITLDSPHNRNALSAALMAQLAEALDRAAADDDVRAVELTHTGPAFCAGADLTEARQGGMAAGTQSLMGLLRQILALPKPVLASVGGHVRAGGMGLVGACDIAVAGPGSTFAFSEVRIGLAPAIISLTTLDLMRPRAASRYYLTGATFDAAQAAEMGLITVATTGDDLDGLLAGLLDQIRETSPQGAAETKRLLSRARRQRLAAESEEMAAWSARLFASEEAQEGIHAFLERRPPSWRQ